MSIKNIIFILSISMFAIVMLITCSSEDINTIKVVNVTNQMLTNSYTYNPTAYTGVILPISNVAKLVGFNGINAGRSKWCDINNDNWLDLITLDLDSTNTDDAHVYLSSGGTSSLPQFSDVTLVSNILQQTSPSHSGRIISVMIVGDVDNDGSYDIFTGAAKQTTDLGDRNEIMLNNGAGVFTIVPTSGVGNYSEAIVSAGFLDFNLDGMLDLFVGNSYSTSVYSYPPHLYQGQGNGHFTEVTTSSKLDTVTDIYGLRNSSRPTWGVTTFDYNNDGYQDILTLSYGRQWNRLMKNVNGAYFEDVSFDTGIAGDDYYIDQYYNNPYGYNREEPFRSNANTFDASVADFDNDGDLDLYLGGIEHNWASPSSDPDGLLVNLGMEYNYKFVRDPSRGITRLPQDPNSFNQGDLHSGWVDFDNDGLLDFILASSDYPDNQRMRIFKQLANHNFIDVTTLCGVDWINCGQISIGDFNRDGVPDIVSGTTNMRLTATQVASHELNISIFKPTPTDNNWITVKLEGLGAGGANRMGYGSRVYVKTGNTTQIRELNGGIGHCGHQDAMECHFGLGKSSVIDELRVRWSNASRSEQVFSNVTVNHFIKIKEGQSNIETIM